MVECPLCDREVVATSHMKNSSWVLEWVPDDVGGGLMCMEADDPGHHGIHVDLYFHEPTDGELR